MKALKKWMVLGLACSFPLSGLVLADETPVADLDVDVSVVDVEATAEDAINVIELPAFASDIAAEASAAGVASAKAAIEASSQEAEKQIQASGRLSAEEVAAIVADAMARSEAAISNANAAATSARENAEVAREAAEEALKNALSGADYQGSLADVQAIIDNLPEDVKDRLPVDLKDLLENVLDIDPAASVDVGIDG